MATRADATETAAPTDAVDRATKWAIALFFVALFIPGSFNMGVRMTPYRLYLIAMAIPAVLRYRADPTLRFTAVDALVFLTCAWRSLSLFVNHGTSEVILAGATFVELFFGYILGRVYIRSVHSYIYLFKCYLLFIVVSFPFAVLEAILRQRVLRDIFAIFFFHSERSMDGGQIRFGLLRPLVSFEHAMLFGAFCAIGLGNIFYIFNTQIHKKLVSTAFIGFMTALSISTSSIINMVLQLFLISYNSSFKLFRTRWFVLTLSGVIFWFAFPMFAGKSLIEFIALEVALSPYSGEGRLGQIEWGLKSVYRNPFFGLGTADLPRPFWHNSALDNFWLATMVRSGIPTAAFLVLAFFVHFAQSASAPYLTDREKEIRTGHLIPLVALFFSLGMHGLWGGALVFVMFYIGAGAWIYDTPRAAPPRPWRPGMASEGPRRAQSGRRGPIIPR